MCSLRRRFRQAYNSAFGWFNERSVAATLFKFVTELACTLTLKTDSDAREDWPGSTHLQSSPVARASRKRDWRGRCKIKVPPESHDYTEACHLRFVERGAK